MARTNEQLWHYRLVRIPQRQLLPLSKPVERQADGAYPSPLDRPGKEGVEIPVVVYTNGDSAELFFNGRSLGRKTIDKQEEMQALWLVPYQPGTISAIAYKDGKKIAQTSRETVCRPEEYQHSQTRSRLHHG